MVVFCLTVFVCFFLILAWVCLCAVIVAFLGRPNLLVIAEFCLLNILYKLFNKLSVINWVN